MCALIAKPLCPKGGQSYLPADTEGNLSPAWKPSLSAKILAVQQGELPKVREAESDQKDEPVVGKACDLGTLCSTGWFP